MQGTGRNSPSSSSRKRERSESPTSNPLHERNRQQDFPARNLANHQIQVIANFNRAALESPRDLSSPVSIALESLAPISPTQANQEVAQINASQENLNSTRTQPQGIPAGILANHEIQAIANLDQVVLENTRDSISPTQANQEVAQINASQENLNSTRTQPQALQDEARFTPVSLALLELEARQENQEKTPITDEQMMQAIKIIEPKFDALILNQETIATLNGQKDILFSQDEFAKRNPANIRYRNFVDNYREYYNNTESTDMKNSVAKTIIMFMIMNGDRFLQDHPTKPKMYLTATKEFLLAEVKEYLSDVNPISDKSHI